jgi:hypothetical protein
MDNNEKRMLIVDNTIEMLTATRNEMLDKGAPKERIYAVEQEIQSAKQEFDRLFEAWASGRDEIGRIQDFMNLVDMAAEEAAVCNNDVCNNDVDETVGKGIDKYLERAGDTDWSMCNEFIVEWPEDHIFEKPFAFIDYQTATNKRVYFNVRDFYHRDEDGGLFILRKYMDCVAENTTPIGDITVAFTRKGNPDDRPYSITYKNCVVLSAYQGRFSYNTNEPVTVAVSVSYEEEVWHDTADEGEKEDNGQEA